jgi:AraC-like DNA-binding protein
MTRTEPLWTRARGGDLRGALAQAHAALAAPASRRSVAETVELHLIAASCQMRQGHHAEALTALDAATAACAAPAERDERLALRVRAWRAELAYFQGRYSAAEELIESLPESLERAGEWAYVAFALRIRIAILLARAEYARIASIAPRALAAAERSADGYVMVQVLNILGAFHFDRATSKLPEPHARAHLSSLDPRDAAPMEEDAREALGYFDRARVVAKRDGNEFAAWYVAGNIERLQILLGHAEIAVRAIRKRLAKLQARGATYDEIVTRSNLAWGLRVSGRHREALHELDVALRLARETGTFNVLLEFLHYDRSVVLDALGDRAGARAEYRRYVRIAGSHAATGEADAANAPKRPLEPLFLKRADRYIVENLSVPLPVAQIAAHCGVSWRTLERTFMDFRGLTPVAHVRNMRLQQAHEALLRAEGSVAEIAGRFGFRSPNTFALEYRKRFGIAPSRSMRSAPAPREATSRDS